MRMLAKILVLGALLALAGAPPSWAMDLGTAKTQGLVGERPDGYLGAVAAGRADVQALVADINAKRRSHYQTLADKNGTPLSAVEQVVGQKLIARAGPGEYVMTPGGQWVRK